MCDKFIASLKKLGVKNGDILYISSDFTLFLADLADTYGIENINYELNTLIDNLQELVGNNGTILFTALANGDCNFIVKVGSNEVHYRYHIEGFGMH